MGLPNPRPHCFSEANVSQKGGLLLAEAASCPRGKDLFVLKEYLWKSVYFFHPLQGFSTFFCYFCGQLAKP